MFRSMGMTDDGNGFQADGVGGLVCPTVIQGKEGCGTGGKSPGAVVQILHSPRLILSHKLWASFL